MVAFSGEVKLWHESSSSPRSDTSSLISYKQSSKSYPSSFNAPIDGRLNGGLARSNLELSCLSVFTCSHIAWWDAFITHPHIGLSLIDSVSLTSHLFSANYSLFTLSSSLIITIYCLRSGYGSRDICIESKVSLRSTPSSSTKVSMSPFHIDGSSAHWGHSQKESLRVIRMKSL